MPVFFLVIAVIGCWLLFAGPIYQAALELQEEDTKLDHDALKGVALPERVSPWWWLLPPVKFILERQRVRQMRSILMHTLTPQQLAPFATYLNKATGWLLVAGGGLCVALNETFDLFEYMRWSIWACWATIIVLALASIMYTISRMRASNRLNHPSDEALLRWDK